MLTILDEVMEWMGNKDQPTESDSPTKEPRPAEEESTPGPDLEQTDETAIAAEEATPGEDIKEAKPVEEESNETAIAAEEATPGEDIKEAKPVEEESDETAIAAQEATPKEDIKGVEEPDMGKAESLASSQESYASSTSHNKRRQCPHCPFFGTHLARHLKVQHSEGLTERDVALDVAKSDRPEEVNKAFNPHSQQYQCNIPGCNKVVTRKGQHLRRQHKIIDKEALKNASKQFTKVTSTNTKRASPLKTSHGQPKVKKPRLPAKRSSTCTKPQSPAIKSTTTSTIKTANKKTKREEKRSSEGSSEEEESFHSDQSDEDEEKVDPGYLDIEADLDELSNYADTDQEELDESRNFKWKEYYLKSDKRKNTRQHFVSSFFRYLLHIEGGSHSEEQALIHTRQVHNVMEEIDPKGTDLASLVRNQSMDIWGKFCGPKLKNKILKGNTIKTYITSLELFVKFIKKGFFYNHELLPEGHHIAIVSLETQLPDYRSTIHRRTAIQTTTRKVDQAFTKMTPEDLRKLQDSEVAKEAIKILGRAAEQKIPTRNEFTLVRDYLLVTTLYENGSRPSPLENVKVNRFKQAQQAKNGRWVMLVDEHKTSRHYGPAELVFDDRSYGYMKIFVNYIRPAYAEYDDEDAIFIKEDGKQFPKGTIGRRVKEFFIRAGIRSDINVSATKIRQIHSNEASEMSPKKRKAIASHMKHQITTADSNYVLKVNVEKAGRAHELMGRIIQGTAHSTQEKPKEELDDWKKAKDEQFEVEKETKSQRRERFNRADEAEKEDDKKEEQDRRKSKTRQNQKN